MVNDDHSLPYRLRKMRLKADGFEGVQSIERDRPRGILTDDDREFITEGAEDRTERAADDKRRRLRSRVRNALMDFTLLYTELDEDARRAIFDPPGQALEEPEEILGGVISTLAFLYEGAERFGLGFESSLQTAVAEVERQNGWREVEVTLDVRRSNQTVDTEAALQKFENGDPLTDREAGALLRSGNLPRDEWEELADRLDPAVAEATETVERLSGSGTDPAE